VTGASRFLIGLATCFATRDGINQTLAPQESSAVARNSQRAADNP